MPSFTRVNGSGTVTGTLYSPNCYSYLITVKNSAATAFDLQSEDSESSLTNGLIEAIVDELNPLVWFTPTASSGVIHVILDQGNSSATEIQTRIRRIKASRTITANTGTSTAVTSSSPACIVSGMVGSTVSGSGVTAGTTISATGSTTAFTLSGATSSSLTATSLVLTYDITGTTVATGTSITIA